MVLAALCRRAALPHAICVSSGNHSASWNQYRSKAVVCHAALGKKSFAQCVPGRRFCAVCLLDAFPKAPSHWFVMCSDIMKAPSVASLPAHLALAGRQRGCSSLLPFAVAFCCSYSTSATVKH